MSSVTYLLGVECVCRDPDESLVGRKIEVSGEDTRYVALESSVLLNSSEVSRTGFSFVSNVLEESDWILVRCRNRGILS